MKDCHMGGCVSVPVTSLVTEFIEGRTASRSIPLKPYKCYVNDTIILKCDDVSLLCTSCSNVHFSIKFIMKKENSSGLPFVNVLVVHNDSGAVRTSLYCKLCDTGLILVFPSYHALEYGQIAFQLHRHDN